MEPCEDGKADLVRLDVHVNGVMAPALARIVIRDDAVRVGQHLVNTLKQHVERQSFDVSLQALVGSRVLAKARIAPYRKDVLIKGGKTVGGGDQTRKQKLLSKQAKGKARMKSIGKVTVTQEAFLAVLTAPPPA